MSRKTKIIIVIVAVIIIAVLAYFIFRKPKAAQTPPSMTPVIPPAGSGNTNVSTPAETFPLQSGSKGENTKRLQMALNRISPGSKISEDGIFGNATASKIQLTLPTSAYMLGPKVTEDQLTNIIRLGNNA